MEFDFKLEGFDELNAILNKLPDELEAKAIDSAARAGAKVIADAAREKAPEAEHILTFHDAKAQQPGFLKKQIRPRKMGTGHYAVSAGRDAFWALFVEMGSFVTGERHRKDRSRKTKGKHKRFADGGSTGTMPAFPFLRPAFDENYQAAMKKMAEVLASRVEKLALGLAGLKKTRRK